MRRFITIDPETWWPTLHLHGHTARYYTDMKKLPKILKMWIKKTRTPEVEEPIIPPEREIPIEREPYEPFSGENKPCRKCGSWDIGWTYMPHGIIFRDMTDPGVFSNEWMHRRCQTCSYSWREECPTYPLSD